MRLTELEPQFVRYETRIDTWTVVVGDPLAYKDGDPTKEVTGPREWTIPVPTFAEAQGVQFLCPKCFAANESPVGTHLTGVTFEGRGVQPNQGTHNKQGEPVRWSVTGDSFENLTTHPSILTEDGCGWHGFIRNGQIE